MTDRLTLQQKSTKTKKEVRFSMTSRWTKTRKRIIVVQGIYIVLIILLTTTLSYTFCFQTKLLVRQIRSQPTNVTHALNILSSRVKSTSSTVPNNRNNNHNELLDHNDNNTDKDDDSHLVVIEALRVCGRAKDPDVALNIYNEYPSEASRTTTISVLGNCNEHMQAMDLLKDNRNNHNIGPPSAASYNAAIAACGKAKDYKLALDIYQNQIPKDYISIVTTNALLTVLANSKQGSISLGVLQTIMNTTNKIAADSVTIHLVTLSLVRSSLLTEACTVLEDVPHNTPIEIKSTVYDLISSGYSQRSDWKGIERVEKIRRSRQHGTSQNFTSTENQYRFAHWEGLEKVGNSWVLGNVVLQNIPLNLTVGVRPNRNPAKNGIRLVFFENVPKNETAWVQHKLGYLLMQNTNKQSSLLGMFLKPSGRGNGLAKYFLSVWIRFCLEASIRPVTGMIRKPLLSLVLQHSFGFIPIISSGDGAPNNGVLVEVCRDRDDPDGVLLYSPFRKSLIGAFCSWELENQNIKLVSHPPATRGRMVRIGCKLEPSDIALLKETCDEILPSSSWTCELSGTELERIFLGKTC
jgi:pentatricopeptide repeat protein